MLDSGWAAWFSLVQSKNCSLPNTLLWVRDGNSFLCDRIQSINAYVTKWAWSPTFSSSFSKKLKSVASPGRKHSSSWNSRHRIKHCPEQTAPFLLILSAMYVWLWVAVKKHSWCSAVSAFSQKDPKSLLLTQPAGSLCAASFYTSASPGKKWREWPRSAFSSSSSSMLPLKPTTPASRSSTLIFWVFDYNVYLSTFWIMHTQHIIKGKNYDYGPSQ